jgi:hypothetical protein
MRCNERCDRQPSAFLYCPRVHRDILQYVRLEDPKPTSALQLDQPVTVRFRYGVCAVLLVQGLTPEPRTPSATHQLGVGLQQMDTDSLDGETVTHEFHSLPQDV